MLLTNPHQAKTSGDEPIGEEPGAAVWPGFETIKSSTEVSVGLFLFMVRWDLRASDS